ncbi:SIR2 family protein [Empedobacter tilapiae]
MINKFLSDIQIIKNAMQRNKLVIFAGAGISIDAKVPGWTELIKELKLDLDLPKEEKDALKIAQIYFNERNEKEYIEKIRELLGHKKFRYNDIHEELFKLNPEHILTTNFEDLLEQVIFKNSHPFSVIKEDKDLPFSNNTKLLVKIHGDLEKGNLVFKEDDYLNYSQEHPLLDSFIKSIFSSKVVLFVGYSFSDYNLKQILQYVRNILGHNFQNAYLLSIDKKVEASHRQYLKNKGVNIVNHFDSNYEIQIDDKIVTKNFIDDFLTGENIFNKNFQLATHFSEKGNLLLNLLKFIRIYDKEKESINDDNVVDKMYDSLKRFEEIKYLPANFTSKLYPFKSSADHEILIENDCLLLKNEVLTRFFFEKIKINDEKNKFHLIELDNKLENRVAFILKKLNNSLISEVAKENVKPDSLGYKGFSNDRVNIEIFNHVECDCARCKFQNFEFNKSLKNINNYNVTETSAISGDMMHAFLNYKFGNHLRAFEMYEEIASKAWMLQKYISYYIAKTNMKNLRNLLKFEIDKDEKDKYFEKIDEIDLDKLLHQIPFRSNSEYELLKIVRDDIVLKNSSNKINDYYNKVVENYKLHNKPYSGSITPFYPNLIYHEAIKLLYFYNYNFIVYDKFSDFKNIINKVIEATIISYATSDTYSYKITEFNSSFFSIYLAYSKPSMFDKLIKEYNIQNLKFDDASIEKLLSYFNNFLNSYYKKDKFFGGISQEKNVENQLKQYYFREQTNVYFNNFLLIISIIKLDINQFSLIMDSIINYLNSYKLNSSEIKFLKKFIKSHSSYLNKEYLDILIQIIVKNVNRNLIDNLFIPISKIAFENKIEVINELSYARYLYEVLTFKSDNNELLSSLWCMSNSECKKYFYDKIIEKLNEDFDIELYKITSLNKILDYNLYFDDYVGYINKINSSNNINKDGYDSKGEKPMLYDFEFYNELYFIFKLNIKSKDKRLEKLTNLHEFMKFGIYRDQYDLNKFKVEWLLLFNSPTYLNEFKKIPKIKTIIKKSLKENYNDVLAKIYTQYFL